MDLESLQRRKAELEQARINLTNSYQVITGHMQECDYMTQQVIEAAAAKSEANVDESLESA
jgi:hypothetical protein